MSAIIDSFEIQIHIELEQVLGLAKPKGQF